MTPNPITLGDHQVAWEAPDTVLLRMCGSLSQAQIQELYDQASTDKVADYSIVKRYDPTGGILSGSVAAMKLDGWTREEEASLVERTRALQVAALEVVRA